MFISYIYDLPLLGEDSGGSSAGAAYIFEREANGPNDLWNQVALLRASDASLSFIK